MKNSEEISDSGSTVFDSLATTLLSATPSKKVSRLSESNKAKLRKTPEAHREYLLQQLESCYTVTGDGCWVWTGPVDKNGVYASVVGFSKSSGFSGPRAAVIQYERHHGRISPGMRPRLTCGNPLCIRTEHIDLITLSQLMQIIAIKKTKKEGRM